jgi:protein-S-isoprenylcysteine O-methyltransferase Ste14
MSDTDLARLLLLIVLSGALAAGIAMRAAGVRAAGKLPRSVDGPAIASAIRVLALAFYGGLLLFLVWPPAMAWAAVDVPRWARWAGAIFMAGGFGLALWSRWTLGASSTLTSVPAPGGGLVTRGPYRRLRHPIYTAAFLVIPGVAGLTANLFILAAGLGALTVLVVRTPREEALLLGKFGDDYRAVMDRTGRWLPRLR